MRISTYVAALGILLAVAACNGGVTTPAGLCSGQPVAQVNGAIYVTRGQATAAEAGALFSVVKRERTKCDDVIMTVTDSAAPRPRYAPWVDGDASMLKAGSELYQRVGAVPGQELVAQSALGEWVWLSAQRIQ
ncbi:MAG TPA: hypothetical protein VGB92_19965 [Longimicrobium sp.]|jgi:hypothetical protein